MIFDMRSVRPVPPLSSPRRAGVLLLAVVAVLGGCSDDGSPTAATSSTHGATPSSGGGAPKEAMAELAAGPPEAVAQTTGTVKENGTGKSVPARAEIVAVRAAAGSTVLWWRLSVPGGEIEVDSKPWSSRTVGDTDRVRIAVPSADLELSPGIWSPGMLRDCACSKVPHTVGPRGVELSALYPALPESATEAEVRIPGFEAVRVPVTRS